MKKQAYNADKNTVVEQWQYTTAKQNP